MNKFNQIDRIEKSTLKEDEKNKVKKSYERMMRIGYIIAFSAVLLLVIGISIGVILENPIIMLLSMILPFIVLFIYGLLTKKLFPEWAEYCVTKNRLDISGINKEQYIELKKLENKKRLLIVAIVAYIVLEIYICYKFDINSKSTGATIVTVLYVVIIGYLFKKCENKIKQIKCDKNKK